MLINIVLIVVAIVVLLLFLWPREEEPTYKAGTNPPAPLGRKPLPPPNPPKGHGCSCSTCECNGETIIVREKKK